MTLRALILLSPLLCTTALSAQTLPGEAELEQTEQSRALELLLNDTVEERAQTKQSVGAAQSEAAPAGQAAASSTGNPVEDVTADAAEDPAAPRAQNTAPVDASPKAAPKPAIKSNAQAASAPRTTGNPVEITSPLAPTTSLLPEERALASGQAQNMRDAAATLSARQGSVSPGAGLRLEVVYGRNYPVLVCKIELTCLIELEDGEEMLDSPLLSDPVRWEIALRIRDVEPVKTYVSLKPRPDAEQSMLSLFTNRRTYVILLNPDLQRHTPMLAFHYPDTEARQLAARIAETKATRARALAETKAAARARKAARAARTAKSGLPSSKGAVPADELDFNFTLRGKARFKPVRVYTDGRKTYIDLPEGYRGEMPALVATSGNANGAVNVKSGKGGRQLIADKPLEAFTLIAGRQKIHVKKRTR